MTSRKTLLAGLGILLLTLLGTASSAQAQYAAYPPSYYPPPPPPPPRGVYRAGVVYGFSLGLGGITLEHCGDVCGFSFMGEVHLGGMIGPRLALMGDFWEGVHYFNDSSLGSGENFNGVYTLAMQYWLTDILWVKGGIGFGRIQINVDDDFNGFNIDDESGFAFLLAAGVEIVQNYNFALDLQLRYGNVAYPSQGSGGDGDTSMFAFMVGFNWY